MPSRYFEDGRQALVGRVWTSKESDKALSMSFLNGGAIYYVYYYRHMSVSVSPAFLGTATGTGQPHDMYIKRYERN